MSGDSAVEKIKNGFGNVALKFTGLFFLALVVFAVIMFVLMCINPAAALVFLSASLFKLVVYGVYCTIGCVLFAMIMGGAADANGETIDERGFFTALIFVSLVAAIIAGIVSFVPPLYLVVKTTLGLMGVAGMTVAAPMALHIMMVATGILGLAAIASAVVYGLFSLISSCKSELDDRDQFGDDQSNSCFQNLLLRCCPCFGKNKDDAYETRAIPYAIMAGP